MFNEQRLKTRKRVVLFGSCHSSVDGRNYATRLGDNTITTTNGGSMKKARLIKPQPAGTQTTPPPTQLPSIRELVASKLAARTTNGHVAREKYKNLFKPRK
jgi:hypothetical protein